jgi:hypothetical protein
MELYSIFHILCSTGEAVFPRATLRRNYERGNQGNQASLAGVLRFQDHGANYAVGTSAYQLPNPRK